MNSDPAPRATGFVLAGGRSSRMGRDKALVQLAGRTLAANAVDLLQRAGLNATIAGARSELGALAPVIADHVPDQGPLRGICSALASADTDLAIFLSIDQPLLPSSLLAYLIQDAGITGAAVTLTSVNGFPQTFPVILRISLLPLLQRELEAGRTGCYASFQTAAKAINETIREIPAELLAQAGRVFDHNAVPPYRWFLNVNTPSDLERAARLRVS